MNPRMLFFTLLGCSLLQSLALQAQELKFECVDSEESYQAQTYNPPQPIGNVNAVIIYAVFNSPPDTSYISYLDSLPSWYNQLGGRMQSFLQTASHGLHNINISILTNGAKPFRAADDIQPGGSVYSNISPLFMSSLMDSVDAHYDLGEFDNDGPDGEPNTPDDDGYVDFVSLNVLWPAGRGGVGLNITGPSNGEWISSDTSYHSGGGYIRVTGQRNGAIQQIVYDQAANEGIPMHEYGHVFGLPDMDHSFTTDLNHYSLGGFDIMAGGGFNGVASIYNPWFRDEMLGWITPTQITGNLTGETMTDLINTQKLLKYSPSVPSNALPSQKFYVSYHTRANQWESNWPMSDPELGGLLIWHKTSDGTYSDRRRQPIDIEAAHGKFNWTEDATSVSNTGVPNAATGLDSLEIRKVAFVVGPDRIQEIQGPYYERDRGSASIFFMPNAGKEYAFYTNPNSNFYRNNSAESFGHSITSGLAIKNITRSGGTTRLDFYTNNYTITSNATLPAGTWYIRNNVTVASGVTLTINPGATLLFDSGKKLTVNGSLQALGTSSQPIIFDRSGASGTWNGLWIENVTANSNLDYCTLRNASNGIRLRYTSGTVTVDHTTLTNNQIGFVSEYSSPFTIQNSTIQNNSYGIWVTSSAASGAMKILYNNISSNGAYHGVNLYNGADAFLGFNNISNNSQHGVSCHTNSDPYMRSASPSPDYGNNIITYNGGAGVKAVSNSYPLLGVNFQDGVLKDYYGYNEIHSNSGYQVENANTSGTIMAERNYWSANPSDPATPEDLYGSVDYDPVLPEDPTIVADGKEFSLQKSLIAFEEAFVLESQGDFQAAADLYLKLLESDPEADNVGFGVSGLIRCYKGLDRRKEVSELMDQLIDAFPETALAASAKDHSLPYLVQRGDHDLALSRSQELLSQNRENVETEPSLLFQIASIYYLKSAGQAGDDLLNAQDFYQELIQKYADSDFAFFAGLELEELGGSGLGRPATDSPPNTLTQKSFELKANYPNPFNPETVIRFLLAEEQPVQLRIFDATGRSVRTLADKNYSKGEYAISWDGKDDQGVGVTSGIYVYKLIVGQQSQTRKMVLLR